MNVGDVVYWVERSEWYCSIDKRSYPDDRVLRGQVVSVGTNGMVAVAYTRFKGDCVSCLKVADLFTRQDEAEAKRRP